MNLLVARITTGLAYAAALALGAVSVSAQPTQAPVAPVAAGSSATIRELGLINVPYAIAPAGPATTGALIVITVPNVPSAGPASSISGSSRVTLTVTGAATGTFSACSVTSMPMSPAVAAPRSPNTSAPAAGSPAVSSPRSPNTSAPAGAVNANLLLTVRCAATVNAAPGVGLVGPGSSSPTTVNGVSSAPMSGPGGATIRELALTNVPYSIIQSGPLTSGALIAISIPNVASSPQLNAISNDTRVTLTVTGAASGTYSGCRVIVTTMSALTTSAGLMLAVSCMPSAGAKPGAAPTGATGSGPSTGPVSAPTTTPATTVAPAAPASAPNAAPAATAPPHN